MSAQIATRLFDELDSIGSSVSDAFKLATEDLSNDLGTFTKYSASARRATHGLLLFIEEFMTQFFVFGFNLSFTSIKTDGARTAINSLLGKKVMHVPKAMIKSFNEYHTTLSSDLKVVGYNLDVQAALRAAYCSSLPFLLKSFVEDGKTVISNYDEICKRIEKSTEMITVICQR